MDGNPPPDAAVELAMVAIRRRQQRRTLAGQALGEAGAKTRTGTKAEAEAKAGAEAEAKSEAKAGVRVTVAITEVLDIVEANATDGRRTMVTDVARSLEVDQPRASKLVHLAVEAGMLRRCDDPTDARRSLLQLTGSGQAHLDQVHEFRRAVFAAAMDGWTDDERSTFATLLTRFVAALHRPSRS
jgi:DNA-binding MarR family transcriptional regulator